MTIIKAAAKQPAKCNLSSKQCAELRMLKSNTNIRIVKADKGNMTLVMNASDYRSATAGIVGDRTQFTRVDSSPLNKHKAMIKKFS